MPPVVPDRRRPIFYSRTRVGPYQVCLGKTSLGIAYFVVYFLTDVARIFGMDQRCAVCQRVNRI